MRQCTPASLLEPLNTDWWFGTCFVFPYIGDNHPNWLIVFRGVQSTNQNILPWGWLKMWPWRKGTDWLEVLIVRYKVKIFQGIWKQFIWSVQYGTYLAIPPFMIQVNSQWPRGRHSCGLNHQFIAGKIQDFNGNFPVRYVTNYQRVPCLPNIFDHLQLQSHYPLVICSIAIEHGHRNSGCSHKTSWIKP